MAFDDPPRIQAHVCVKDGKAAIAFYGRSFGAVCTMLQQAEDGLRILHANLQLFGGEVMLHDEFPEWQPDVLAPASRGGASVTINVNLPTPAEVDAIVARAQAAGATVTLPPGDVFWGARYGRVRDPFGHVWAFNAPLAPATMKST
ncbi:MAG: VOC family protein [Hyphomicrobiaceae bacterium]|nr:VOC family protein [Hyphomicrobiaceae bacterium]